jgi:catechol 2,3-dioxygenase-like lactoylglutathione lyase family enzyme
MTAFNHITILVEDIERSKKFYEETLGLKTTFELDISGEQFSKVTGNNDVMIRFAALKPPSSPFIVELAQFINPRKKISNNDFRHFAFEVDDVDTIYKKLKKMGVEMVSEPVTISDCHPKVDGKRFFYFRDPDKNLVELFNKRDHLYSS